MESSIFTYVTICTCELLATVIPKCFFHAQLTQVEGGVVCNSIYNTVIKYTVYNIGIVQYIIIIAMMS